MYMKKKGKVKRYVGAYRWSIGRNREKSYHMMCTLKISKDQMARDGIRDVLLYIVQRDNATVMKYTIKHEG